MNSYVKGALVFAGGYVAAGAVTSVVAHKSPRGLMNLEAIAKWPLVLKNLIQGGPQSRDGLPVDQAQVLAPLAQDLPGIKNGGQLPAFGNRQGVTRPRATDGLSAGTSFDVTRNDLPVAFRGVL